MPAVCEDSADRCLDSRCAAVRRSTCWRSWSARSLALALLFEYGAAWVVRIALVGVAGYARRVRGARSSSSKTPAATSSPAVAAPARHRVLSERAAVAVVRARSKGHGTDAAIDSYHQGGGRVREGPDRQGICSALTLGFGGSGGKEVRSRRSARASARSASAWASAIARAARCSPRMAGGVGAIFRAPFAGALFAAEILYRDAEPRARP